MNLRSKILSAFATFIFMSMGPAWSFTTLKNEDAKKYLGDVKTHVMSEHYVYAVLARSHRDSMHGRFSDGLLFVPDGGKILFLRNKDGERKFIVPAPEGREKEPVTEEAWRQKISNVLSDDNPLPYVFLDDSKKEVAILCVGKGAEVKSSQDEKGRLEISLKIEGSKSRGSNRRIRF